MVFGQDTIIFRISSLVRVTLAQSASIKNKFKFGIRFSHIHSSIIASGFVLSNQTIRSVSIDRSDAVYWIGAFFCIFVL